MKLPIDPAFAVSQALSQKTASPATATGKDRESLRKTCQEFEALLIKNMMKGMRLTLPGESLSESSMAMEMSYDLFDQAVAEGAARGHGLGIAEVLFRQLAGPLAAVPQETADGDPEDKG